VLPTYPPMLVSMVTMCPRFYCADIVRERTHQCWKQGINHHSPAQSGRTANNLFLLAYPRNTLKYRYTLEVVPQLVLIIP
jgi:hypothetical protein